MKGERERGITMGFSLNKVNLLVTSLVCLSVCPVDRQQQRRPVGLLLRSGAGCSYRSLPRDVWAA